MELVRKDYTLFALGLYQYDYSSQKKNRSYYYRSPSRLLSPAQSHKVSWQFSKEIPYLTKIKFHKQRNLEEYLNLSKPQPSLPFSQALQKALCLL